MNVNFQKIIQDAKSIDPSDIRADNIGSWPLLVKFGACVLAFVVVIAGVYFLKIKAQQQQLQKLERSEKKLRSDFSARAYESANLSAYRDQMKELQLRLDALVNQLPSDTEVPGLLEDITETGLNSGLTINSIELKAEVVKDYYIELPIQILATGGYHDFATFVSGVSGLPRIVTLHDFKITPQSDSLLELSIEARTYRYKDRVEEE